MVARFVGLTSTFDEQRLVINDIAQDVDTILSDYATQGYVDSSVSGLSTFSGNYNDLTNKPQIPTDVSDLSNSVGFVTSGSISGFLTSGSLVGYVTSGYVDNSVVGFLTSGSLVGYVTSGYVDNSVVGFLTSGSLVGYVDEAFVLTTVNDYTVGLDDYNNLNNKPWILGNQSISTSNKVGIGSTLPTSDLDVLGDIKISGIITATTFSGNLSGTATTATTAETAQGIVGNPNISVGFATVLNSLNVSDVTTSSQTRFLSVAEKIIRVDGNTVSIAYTSAGSNIGLCTNPTGDISLEVTGIPVDSSFDNHAISFSLFINQTGTARSCTSVTLNGVSKSIKWAGGSLAVAISGVTTTSGYDIYNFVGLNTVGSASTAENYEVFGVVNGGFR